VGVDLPEFALTLAKLFLVRPKAMRRRIALPRHFPHTADRQCEINQRHVFSFGPAAAEFVVRNIKICGKKS
jgi:hypothetical protein